MNEVETGWLIEVVSGGRAWWWCGPPRLGAPVSWSPNASDAVRFARKTDGERIRDRLADTDDYMAAAIVTDHMWVPSGAV